MLLSLLVLTACSKDVEQPNSSNYATQNPVPVSTPEEGKQVTHSEIEEAYNSGNKKDVETESTVGDFIILETKNKVKIKRYIGKVNEVEIPQTLNEKPVVEIGDEAFKDRGIVKSIVIPESVNKIGRYAFSDTIWFQGLSDEFVIVGDGVLIKYNGKADKIVVPDNVKSIGYNEVFASCGMSEIVIPNSVVYLNEGAFSHCENLKSIVIPDSVIYLGDYLFYESSVAEITIPASVEKFGNGVFKTKSPVTIYGQKGSEIEKYINGNDYFTFKTLDEKINTDQIDQDATKKAISAQKIQNSKEAMQLVHKQLYNNNSDIVFADFGKAMHNGEDCYYIRSSSKAMHAGGGSGTLELLYVEINSGRIWIGDTEVTKGR